MLSAKLQLPRIYRTLLGLGLPIILGQLGIIVVNFADNIMVGHHLKSELAAASFVNNFFALAFVLGMGFSYGLTPLIASAMARDHAADAGSLLRHSLLLNIGVGLLMALVMLIPLSCIQVFGLPPELLSVMRPYYLLQVVSLIFSMAFNAYKQYYDGCGHTLMPMIVMLLSNLLNIFGNYLLIFGHAGFPELGLTGAGISTLIARLFTLAVLMQVFHRLKQYRESKYGFRYGCFQAAIFRRLAALGVPVSMQMGLEAASFTIAVIFVGRIGENALAGHQIISTVTTLGFMIYYGIGAAATILISKQRSMNDYAGIRQTASAAVRICICIGIAVIILILFTRNHIAYLFIRDAMVAVIVSSALLPVILYQFGDALQVVYANALRGLEDVRFLAPAAAIAHIGIAPLLSYIFAFCLGFEGESAKLTAIWCAFPVSLTTLGLMLRSRFRRNLRGHLPPQPNRIPGHTKSYSSERRIL